MTASDSQGAQAMGVLFRVLVVFDTIALLFASVIHINGVNIPLGSGSFFEPHMFYASIVEGLAGIVFAMATYAVLAAKSWAWRMTLIAHTVAILGFTLGLVATIGGTTTFNRDYHLVMMAIFVIGFVLLFTRSAQVALGRIRG